MCLITDTSLATDLSGKIVWKVYRIVNGSLHTPYQLDKVTSLLHTATGEKWVVMGARDVEVYGGYIHVFISEGAAHEELKYWGRFGDEISGPTGVLVKGTLEGLGFINTAQTEACAAAFLMNEIVEEA